LNLLVGTFLTTLVMPIPSFGVRVKVAVSSLDPALLQAMMSSALVLLESVFKLVEVVVPALLTLVLTIASGFIPARVMIVTMKMPTPMLDFPAFKLSEETLIPSASKVPSTPRVPDLPLLSASSTLAVEAVAALS